MDVTILGLSPVPPYNLNLYNYNMHDLIKKLFRLEELLFLNLQTSLTKYISSMIDYNNKQQKFLFYGIQFFKSNYLLPQKIRHTAQRRVLPAAHSSRQECIIFLSVPEFFKTNCLIYPILPEFYQNSFCRTLKKESNSINLDFYKCLYFLSNILMQHTLFKESDSR